MIDNLAETTNSVRVSTSTLKKKISNLKIQVEGLDADLERLNSKIDNVVAQSEMYKTRLKREMGREVKRLEIEMSLLRKQLENSGKSRQSSPSELHIAATVAILDSLLRHIHRGADDIRLASQAFLFPAVYERVMDSSDYYIDTVPPSMSMLIDRGREYVEWIRKEHYAHVTNPDTWEEAMPYIAEWWRNDALPLLYGARDEQWDIDEPLSLPEMMVWRDSPAERPLSFPSIFDAFEIYERFKDEVLESSGLREFEIERFSLDK